MKKSFHCVLMLFCLAAALHPFDCLADEETALQKAAQGVIQIIAHRGASLERPECTLASIQRSIEVGATAVEIDVRTSRDGRLFLLHDDTLDRTTNGTGRASDRTLAELKELDAGSWFDAAYSGERIPTLIEAARASRGKISLLLDLKEQGDDYDRKVVAVIREHGDPGRTVVGVRSVEQAVRFRKLLPEAKQLALIPSVDQIDAFCDANVDFIRLWPRWLNETDEPVAKVRAQNVRLHLNGVSGSLEETLDLLRYQPDSLSSDDPRTQRETLKQIAEGNTPATSRNRLIEKADGTALSVSECRPNSKTFLNRDYRMMQVPNELVNRPRYTFNGGSGHQVQMTFKRPSVVFAAFEYNDTGNWTFPDGESPDHHGWRLWKRAAYRGTSNPDRNGKPNLASIWFRQFDETHGLKGLPPWWVCLAVMDLDDASSIDGFIEGLVPDLSASNQHFDYERSAGAPPALTVESFASTEALTNWQRIRRQAFMQDMLYPYDESSIEITAKDVTAAGSKCEQRAFTVRVDNQRLFRFFRLQLESSKTDSQRPAIACFMGHGKVGQILAEHDSYQHACALRFAEAGYVVYAMENVGMEPGPDRHLDLDRILRLDGHGWYSLLFAHQRILLDQILADPHVDKQRIGAAGVSTGGLLALSAAAMEPQISATSVQGIFSSMRVSFIRDRNRHCSCGAIPGLLPDYDLPELALLVAPRAMHVSNGATDGFSTIEALRCVELVSPYFVAAGGTTPHFTTHSGGHQFDVDAALDFFDRSL